jgi:sterol desaturase/sphingolipid hydroxylase (fatty acid hydroxylase superfamily)
VNNLIQLAIWAAVFSPAEYLFSFYPIVMTGHERRQNVFLLLFNSYVTAFLIAAVSYLLYWGLVGLVPAVIRAVIGGQPLLLQIVEAALLMDLGVYISHRLSHSRILWRFHEIHHSAEEMNWSVAFRFHPIDLLIYTVFSSVPAVLMGFSVEALLVSKSIHGWQAVASHANLRFGIGPLRHFFVGPQFHHWHHANEQEAYDRNFGGLFVIWDWYFGTLHRPASERPSFFGTTGSRSRSLIDLLADPFQGLGYFRRKIKTASLPQLSSSGTTKTQRAGTGNEAVEADA